MLQLENIVAGGGGVGKCRSGEGGGADGEHKGDRATGAHRRSFGGGPVLRLLWLSPLRGELYKHYLPGLHMCIKGPSYKLDITKCKNAYENIPKMHMRHQRARREIFERRLRGLKEWT